MDFNAWDMAGLPEGAITAQLTGLQWVMGPFVLRVP
jgi:hypothetical protein